MKTLCSALLILIFSLNGMSQNSSNKKPNILFIAVDDLRPELGCYDSDLAKSPNIDALADVGLLFKKAYCQQAICGPSRASVLSGLRPSTSGVTHNYIKLRDQFPDIVTLPQHFLQHGYESVYCGKIYHHGDKDDEMSWNRQPSTDKVAVRSERELKGFALPENQKIREDARKEMFAKYGNVARYGLASGPAYECADVPDNRYVDGYNTDLAIATMKDMTEDGDKPFFLGLGFNKPHLNWIAPKKYWDLYERDSITLTDQVHGPENGAAVGLHPSFELRVRSGIPKEGEIDKELAITLKHAYLACVSYVDAQIGRMIKALDEAGVKDNTIIILWSDHGWHLGDMGIWGKATNYEIATRVPMIIWTPDMPEENRGKTTDALVELVDMYPTLCDLAGLPLPSHLEGQSFKPLLENPDMEWKESVFSQFPSPALREWGAYPLRPAMRETFFGPLLKEVEAGIIAQEGDKWDRELFENDLMGYAMRTKQYRLIVWKDDKNTSKEPVFVELYDHKEDPLETKNIANENVELVQKLTDQLNKGWKGNLASVDH